MKAKLRTMLLSCLALLLVLGMTSVACAYDISFSDVPEDSWFYTDVMTLAESGVIGGYPDGTYRPTKKVTTGEALKMILLAAGYPEPEPAASHWARGYLNFAIEQGFLTRYEDISDLDVNMTRGLVAKLAANALGLSAPGTYGTFTDTDSPYVEALCAAGIVGGYPDGTYRPGASISRAEIAAIVNRIYQSREPSLPSVCEMSKTVTIRNRMSCTSVRSRSGLPAASSTGLPSLSNLSCSMNRRYGHGACGLTGRSGKSHTPRLPKLYDSIFRRIYHESGK